MKAVGWKEFGKQEIALHEFACKSLGNDCSWKHVEKTEDLLLDIAALHLRDVHGITSLGSEFINRIRKSFTRPTDVTWAEGEEPVMKEFRCRNMGMDCGFRYFAQTEELIVDGVAAHAREVHGIAEFTPELIAKVKNSIRIWEQKAA